MGKQGQPKVLFAIGDADWKYTRTKFRRLVERVGAEGRFDLYVASHDEEICRTFRDSECTTYCLPGVSSTLTPEHTVAMTELMIKLTRNVSFPGSRLPIWKVMAMDDYLGSIHMVSQPSLPITPDLLVCPLMGVDNNSTAAAHLYSALLGEASAAKIPVLGLEVSLLGNKQALGASLADVYALKTESSRSFVIREELAAAERAFVLPLEESYFLTCRDDSYLDDYFQQEKNLRQRLGINRGRVVIFIPHHVAFVYEIREMLRSLKALPFSFSVILRADPNIARQGLKEREIAERVYLDDLNALPHVVIDDHGGWLWSLLLSDIVLAPAHSVFTELAAAYGKLTLICQGWGESSWVGDNLYVEPCPAHAMNALRSWVEQRVLSRKSLGLILDSALASPATSQPVGVEYEI